MYVHIEVHAQLNAKGHTLLRVLNVRAQGRITLDYFTPLLIRCVRVGRDISFGLNFPSIESVRHSYQNVLIVIHPGKASVSPSNSLNKKTLAELYPGCPHANDNLQARWQTENIKMLILHNKKEASKPKYQANVFAI